MKLFNAFKKGSLGCTRDDRRRKTGMTRKKRGNDKKGSEDVKRAGHLRMPCPILKKDPRRKNLRG